MKNFFRRLIARFKEVWNERTDHNSFDQNSFYSKTIFKRSNLSLENELSNIPDFNFDDTWNRGKSTKTKRCLCLNEKELDFCDFNVSRKIISFTRITKIENFNSMELCDKIDINFWLYDAKKIIIKRKIFVFIKHNYLLN